MRCSGNRCIALRGEVGVATACAVYNVRPEVCKACLPGDDACQMARRRFHLQALSVADDSPVARGCTRRIAAA